MSLRLLPSIFLSFYFFKKAFPPLYCSVLRKSFHLFYSGQGLAWILNRLFKLQKRYPQMPRMFPALKLLIHLWVTLQCCHPILFLLLTGSPQAFFLFSCAAYLAFSYSMNTIHITFGSSGGFQTRPYKFIKYLTLYKYLKR